MSFSFDANDSFTVFEPATPPDGCTQCGVCLPACPTYLKSEDPEQSPMGRIRLMRALENGDSEGVALEKLESCLGCYSCESVCPSRVDYGTLLDKALSRLHEQRPLPRTTRMMLWLALRGAWIKSILKTAYRAQALGLRALVSKLGLLKLVGLHRFNALLGRLERPVELQNRDRQAGPERRVALFTGCFGSVLEQAIQQALIDVLNALELEVVLPGAQVCCGALHRHTGDLTTAEALARTNIEVFSTEQVHAVLATSSGCGAALKDYGEWLGGEALPAPLMDVSHYLADALKEHKPAFNRLPLKLALHTPCTLRQGEGREEAVVELLGKIPGLRIIPLSGQPRCCGAGGSQMLSQPQMAGALGDDVVEEIRATGADVVVSSNLGCALHLRERLAQAHLDIPLLHPVQLISQAMLNNAPRSTS